MIILYKLTVAVITYNRANYLKEMLDSILMQTYSQFYVRIYDNCSTDNTTEVVLPFLADKRFFYFRHDTTIANNINFALQDCKTGYLLIVHDDDIMLPDMVKEEVSILDQFDEVSIVSTNMHHIDKDGKLIGCSVLSKWIPSGCFINNREYIDILINRGNGIACPTVMFRMAIIRQHNLSFKAKIGGARDCYLWLELNQLEHKFYCIPKPLYNYRIHVAQDSANSPFLLSYLRKPVYELLSKNNYLSATKRKWLKYIDKFVIMEMYNNGYRAFLQIKDTVLLHNHYDWTLFLGMFYKLYVRSVIEKSTFYPYAKKIKKLLCK